MADKNSNIPAYTVPPPPPRLGKLPFWFISAAIMAVLASWVPLVIAAWARAKTSTEPRIQIFQDMYQQPKHQTQEASTLFADGRIMRPKIPGTVARGKLEEDDHFHRGYTLKKNEASGKAETVFFDEFPEQAQVTAALISRGQERYNIYCAPCHGQDGYGNGPINRRAAELQNQSAPGMSWTQAASLHAQPARSRAAGHLYNTINLGIRNMPGYGHQVTEPKDRWAIVAYVRALQLSQDPPSVAAGPEQKTVAEAK